MFKLKAAMFLISQLAPRAYETIGPITEKGVQKIWTDDATQLSSSEEVQPCISSGRPFRGAASTRRHTG